MRHCPPPLLSRFAILLFYVWFVGSSRLFLSKTWVRKTSFFNLLITHLHHFFVSSWSKITVSETTTPLCYSPTTDRTTVDTVGPSTRQSRSQAEKRFGWSLNTSVSTNHLCKVSLILAFVRMSVNYRFMTMSLIVDRAECNVCSHFSNVCIFGRSQSECSFSKEINFPFPKSWLAWL